MPVNRKDKGDKMILTFDGGDNRKFQQCLEEWKFISPQAMIRFWESIMLSSEDKKIIGYTKDGRIQKFTPADELLKNKVNKSMEYKKEKTLKEKKSEERRIICDILHKEIAKARLRLKKEREKMRKYKQENPWDFKKIFVLNLHVIDVVAISKGRIEELRSRLKGLTKQRNNLFKFYK